MLAGVGNARVAVRANIHPFGGDKFVANPQSAAVGVTASLGCRRNAAAQAMTTARTLSTSPEAGGLGVAGFRVPPDRTSFEIGWHVEVIHRRADHH